MPTLTFIIIALTLAALGSLAIGTGLSLLHRAQKKVQQTYLDVLRKRTSWLLLACEPLLAGDTPEDTILYQRFSAHGGEYHDNIRIEVREALQDSQETLDAAFELHRKLSEPTAQKNRPPMKQVEDGWDYRSYADNIGLYVKKL
jgi:hypothetical protein